MNRAVICYYSSHHHNTEKLVKGAAEGLPVDIVDITKTKSKDLSGYALVGNLLRQDASEYRLFYQEF